MQSLNAGTRSLSKDNTANSFGNGANQVSDKVCMTREDYQRIKENFSTLKEKWFKTDKENKYLKNLTSWTTAKEEELNLFKNKVKDLEKANMRAQSQLTNLALKIGQQNVGNQSEFSGIIELLQQDRTSVPGSSSEKELIPIPVGELSTSLPRHPGFEDVKGQELEPDTFYDSLLKKLEESQNESLPPDVIKRILYDNRMLKKKIKFFEKNSEAWKNFKGQDEQSQLLMELRRENVRVNVHNSEMRNLLKAKQEKSIDALTEHVNILLEQRKSLEKQLQQRQSELESTELRCRQQKAELDQLRELEASRNARRGAPGGGGGAEGGAMGGHGAQGGGRQSPDYKCTSIGEQQSLDQGYNSIARDVQNQLLGENAMLMEEKLNLEDKVKVLEKNHAREVTELNSIITQLRQTDRELRAEQQQLQAVIKSREQERVSAVGDQQPLRLQHLLEENTRMRDRLQLYEQEHQRERQGTMVLQAQMNSLQELHEKSRDREDAYHKLLEKNKQQSEEIEKLEAIIKAKTAEMAKMEEVTSKYRAELEEEKLRNSIRRTSQGSTPSPQYIHHSPSELLSPTQRFMPRPQVECDSLPSPTYRTPSPFTARGPGRGMPRDSGRPSYSSGSVNSSRYEPPTLRGAEGGASSSSSTRAETLDTSKGNHVCQRCLREFSDPNKYRIHIQKCKD